MPDNGERSVDLHVLGVCTVHHTATAARDLAAMLLAAADLLDDDGDSNAEIQQLQRELRKYKQIDAATGTIHEICAGVGIPVGTVDHRVQELADRFNEVLAMHRVEAGHSAPESRGECDICGIADCPHGEPLHHHHDGCPSCSQDTADPEPLF